MYNPSAGTGQLTISLWAYWNGKALLKDSPIDQMLIAKRNGWLYSGTMWQLFIAGNGELRFRRRDCAPSYNGVKMPEGKWTYLALSFDGKIASLYVNGQKRASAEFTFGPATTAQLAICDPTTYNHYFNGTIDEVRLYKTALTPDTINDIYTNELIKSHRSD